MSQINNNDAIPVLSQFQSDDSPNNIDPQQIKYKKAVKQISKLINLIKHLKNQISSLEITVENEQNKNLGLLDKVHELEHLNKIKTNHLSPQANGYDKQLENTGTLSQYIDTKRKAEQFESIINEQQKLINQLKQQIEQKNIENQLLSDKCNKLQQQLFQYQSTQNYPQGGCSIQKSLLEKQLQRSEEYIRYLTEECKKLKESSNMKFIKKTSYKPEANASTSITNTNKQDQMINQYKKKKDKYKKQIKSLKESNEIYLKRYEMTLSFVEKQQKFIEQSIINNYANISGGSEVRNHYFGNYIVSHYQTA